MKLHEHKDAHGARLVIKTDDEGAAAITVTARPGESARVFAEAGDLPAITAALYEACGLRPFLVMTAPAARYPLVPGPHGEESVSVTPSPAGRPADAPGVMLAAGGTGIRLTGDEPLLVAVALVAAMQKAEAEPDPAEADELAKVIRSAFFPDSERTGLRPGESGEIAARAALAWMRDREAGNASA